MPLYEFQCQDCKKQFEVLCKVSEIQEPRTCPGCSSQKTKKLVSRTSFQLVGGGWAKDGYGS